MLVERSPDKSGFRSDLPELNIRRGSNYFDTHSDAEEGGLLFLPTPQILLPINRDQDDSFN